MTGAQAAWWPVVIRNRIYFHGIRGRLINPADYVIRTKVQHFNAYIFLKARYLRTTPLVVAYKQQPDFLFDSTFRFFFYRVFVTKTKAARSRHVLYLRLKHLQITDIFSLDSHKLQVYVLQAYFAGNCDDNTTASSLISSNETLSSSSSETATTEPPVKCRTPGELVPNTQNCR